MSIRHDRDLRYGKSRNRVNNRPRTFKNEEAAKAYADKNGIKEYTLENLRPDTASTKKLKIVC